MPTSGVTAFTGSCHCGLVEYSATSPPQNLICCYCITCRRLSGSPFIAWADVPSSSFHISSNSGNLKPLSSDVAKRTICRECGSSIMMEYFFDMDTVSVAAGTIDDRRMQSGVVMKVTEHIFVEQKPGWYEIPEDGVKQCDTFPDGFEGKFAAWKAEQS